MMKYILTACLLLPVPAARAGVDACVTELRGEVHVMKAGSKDWARADRGYTLEEGDSVRTGGNAWCELLFRDGSFVKMDGGSETAIEELRVTGEGRSFSFSLLKGKVLWMAARLRGQALSRFQVRTPSSVCAVRGTDFTVIVSSAGEAAVGLFEGRLAVSGAGEERELSQGWEAASGGAGLSVEERLSRLMKAERRRYARLKGRVEELRKRLQEREDFLDAFAARQAGKLSDLEKRRGEKLDRLKKDK